MLQLYHCDGARSARSLWLIHELGLDVEVIRLAFDMASLRSPEFLSVSPLGRVPCLVDNGLTLFESGAICQYLCEAYDGDGKLYRAPGDPERVQWLQWLHYAETIAVHGAALVQQQVFIAPQSRSSVVQKLESRRLQKSLEVLDHHLKDRSYLLVSGFSAIDTGVAYSVHLGLQMADLPGLTYVRAYLERCASRDAFKMSVNNVP